MRRKNQEGEFGGSLEYCSGCDNDSNARGRGVKLPYKRNAERSGCGIKEEGVEKGERGGLVRYCYKA